MLCPVCNTLIEKRLPYLFGDKKIYNTLYYTLCRKGCYSVSYYNNHIYRAVIRNNYPSWNQSVLYYGYQQHEYLYDDIVVLSLEDYPLKEMFCDPDFKQYKKLLLLT